jgi:hypothetical protein
MNRHNLDALVQMAGYGLIAIAPFSRAYRRIIHLRTVSLLTSDAVLLPQVLRCCSILSSILRTDGFPRNP